MISNFEEIKARADILQVVENFVSLKKFGATQFFGCCPFHGEKTPSFAVNTQLNICKCFGCGFGGDAFKFVEVYLKLDFTEAVKEVAKICHLEVKESYNAAELKNKELKNCLALLNDFFKSELFKNPAALNYLATRGLNKEDLNAFDIGFIPPQKELNEFLKKHTLFKLAHEVNFLKKGYCNLTERISFAFKNPSGEVIGFSARTLDSNPKNAKYINSVNSPVFVKSDFLYNFNNARKSSKKEVIVCEGFFDAISLVKFGFDNVVATCGTAFSDSHLKKLLASFGEANFIFAFDTDQAGFTAAKNAIKSCYDAGKFNTFVAWFKKEDGLKDFGELLQKFNGAKALPKLDLRQILNFCEGFEFYCRFSKKLASSKVALQRALNDCKHLAYSCPSEVFKNTFTDAFRRVFSEFNPPPLPKTAPKAKKQILKQLIHSLFTLKDNSEAKLILEFLDLEIFASFAPSLKAFLLSGDFDEALSEAVLTPQTSLNLQEFITCINVLQRAFLTAKIQKSTNLEEILALNDRVLLFKG